MEKTIFNQFFTATLKNPNAVAIRFENRVFTYKETNRRIEQTASVLLSLGVRPGDCITVNLPNCPTALFLLYAINRLGAIAYFVHPLTPKKQLIEYIEKANSHLLFALNTKANSYRKDLDYLTKIVSVNPYKYSNCFKAITAYFIAKTPLIGVIPFSKFPKNIELPNDISKEEDVAVYLNSGGSNGEPKVIMLTNHSINHLGEVGKTIIKDYSPSKIKMLTAIPLFHGFGLAMGVVTPLANGSSTVLMMKFNPKKAIKEMKKGNVTTIIGVPALYASLLSQPSFKKRACKNLVISFIGGDSVSKKLLERWNNKVVTEGGKSCLYEGYGLTETVTVSNVNYAGQYKENSVGKPLPGILEVILDPDTHEILPPNAIGEIAIGGDTIMKGYLDDPELTALSTFVTNNKSYILTRDLGYLDEDGYLFFKQRIRRIVKVNGVPVCPVDLERIALSFSYIEEAYAYGVPDKEKGSLINLVVVVSPSFIGDKEKIKEEILTSIKEYLSIYSYPKEIIFVAKMPRTSIGKIDDSAFTNC